VSSCGSRPNAAQPVYRIPTASFEGRRMIFYLAKIMETAYVMHEHRKLVHKKRIPTIL
jgi:hypothetical protein